MTIRLLERFIEEPDHPDNIIGVYDSQDHPNFISDVKRWVLNMGIYETTDGILESSDDPGETAFNPTYAKTFNDVLVHFLEDKVLEYNDVELRLE